MEIVPVDRIPVAQSTPTDNLMDLYKVCQKMEVVCEANKGIGLSAVQVGIPWKLFIYKKPDGKYAYMVNCEYKSPDGEKADSIEGCLSLRRVDGTLRHFRVKRFRSVQMTGHQLVVGDKLQLEPVEITEADNIYAVVLQHEIDHFLGRERMIDQIGEELEVVATRNPHQQH